MLCFLMSDTENRTLYFSALNQVSLNSLHICCSMLLLVCVVVVCVVVGSGVFRQGALVHALPWPKFNFGHKKIGEHGLPPFFCVNISVQRKFDPLYEILNEPLVVSIG